MIASSIASSTTYPRDRAVAAACVFALIHALAPTRAHAQAPAAPTPAAPAAKREEVDATKLSKVPKQIKFVEAEYPAAARDQNLEADVILLLDIDDKGKVTQANISEPSKTPDLGFEEAALVAAQQFEFEPAELDGNPVAVQIGYRYRFLLKPKEAPAPPAPTESAQASTPEKSAAPPAPTRPPTVNFSGVLKERGTRLPMGGVVVTVFRELDGKAVGYEATSKADGNFVFFDLDAGPWKILVEQPGYFPFRTTEDVVAGQATAVVYYVERASYNPYDVTVTASKPRKEVSRTSITAAEIDKVPGTAGDPLAVIQNFAGVARVPAFSGLIIVRGSAPEDSKVFVDGVEVPNIYHFGGLRSVIPIGMLDGIDFYPGNFGPEYGRATGGVVDVRTKKLQPKKIGGYADVSILDTSLYLEVPLGDKASIALAGRRSYLDAIINAAVPADAGVNFVVAPRYYDWQIAANYHPTTAHDLRLFVFGSNDKAVILFKDPGQADLSFTSGQFNNETGFERAQLTYRYTPTTSFSNHLRIAAGHDLVDISLGNLIFNLKIFSTQVRDHVEHKLSDWLTLNYGIDFLYGQPDGNIRLPFPPKEGAPQADRNMPSFDLNNTRSTQFSNHYYSPAAFFEAEVKPVPSLRLFPGFRVDHFSRIGQTVFSPRITARHEINKQFQAKAGVGLFMQEPFFDETDPSFGNPDLTVEKAMHYSVGAEYHPFEHLKFDATLFYKDLWRQVSPTDAVTVRNGMMQPLLYDNNGTGRVYGLEIVIRHEFSHNFTGWLAYTLSHAERTDSGAKSSRLFDYDQPHILTAIGSYVLPRNWQIGGRFRLVSGNPRTPITGAVYNASSDRYSPVFGGVNTARVEAFHQLDLRVDKKWVYDAWMLDVYLDVQNLYNRANPEGLTYNFNFRQSKPQQGLPIVPILGIRGEF